MITVKKCSSVLAQHHSTPKKWAPHTFARINFIVERLVAALSLSSNQTSLLLGYNLFNYFKWVRQTLQKSKTPLLLHFFFSFLGQHFQQSLSASTGCLSKPQTRVWRNTSAPITISKGPMARKKKSREQYKFSAGNAVSNFTARDNTLEALETCRHFYSASRESTQQSWAATLSTLTGYLLSSYSSLPLQLSNPVNTQLNFTLFCIFALWRNLNKFNTTPSTVFCGLFYHLLIAIAARGVTFNLETNILQISSTRRQVFICDGFYFKL